MSRSLGPLKTSHSNIKLTGRSKCRDLNQNLHLVTLLPIYYFYGCLYVVCFDVVGVFCCSILSIGNY